MYLECDVLADGQLKVVSTTALSIAIPAFDKPVRVAVKRQPEHPPRPVEANACQAAQCKQAIADTRNAIRH